MVLLIGNYAVDEQESMQRFAQMMLAGLRAVGVPAELVCPRPFLGRIQVVGGFVRKWLGYLDKFVFFPRQLRRKVSAATDLVHICDHSNAMYSAHVGDIPVVVTCHDLLAVRGALGEATDCPASPTGRVLQRWIVSGLRAASAVTCSSPATLRDAQRIVGQKDGHPRLSLIPLGLNYPYHKLSLAEAHDRMKKEGLGLVTPFVLHVGSNLRRKNREGALRILARCKEHWEGRILFAGDPISKSLRSLGDELGIANRIVEVRRPGNELLEALYNCATALLYPSRFEGFGWPVAEAQACGCPVICSNIEPLPEISGGAALTHDVEDEEGFAADILRLANPSERDRWSREGLRNAARFDAEKMIARYLEVYRSFAPQV